MTQFAVRFIALAMLGIGLLASNPVEDRLTAAEPVAAEAVVAGDLQACLEHAAAEFQRCRRHRHSIAVCTAWAQERFNICRNGGEDGGDKPRD